MNDWMNVFSASIRRVSVLEFSNVVSNYYKH